MNAELRQRGISEYVQMLWRHKLAILLPTLAIGIAVFYVVLGLPSIYESRTKLKINPAAIKAVSQTTEDDVSQRINAITEEVTSRSSLEPMITKFGLFERERAGGTPMELLVEKMRKNITIAIIKGSNEKAETFTVAYKDSAPEKARDVTAELAGKYIKKQQETSIRNSEATSQFFEKELAEVKTKLDAIDRQRLDYMLQNVDKLPSGASGLIAQLQSLGNDVKLLRDKENSINSDIGRMRDQRAYISREQNNLREFSEKENAQQQAMLSDISRNPAYIEMLKRKSDLQAQLKNLLVQYRPAHPDVKAKENEIEQISKDIAELEQKVRINNEEIRQSMRGNAELRIKNYDNEKQRIEGEIARQLQLLEQTRLQAEQKQGEVAVIQSRLENVPSAEVALGSFEREYQTAKDNYDELLKKKNEADLQAERDRNLKGESIEIVDAANTPQAPVNASKRYLLMGSGIGAGLGIGLLLALLMEFPRFWTINNQDDVKHYTNLPVLAAVPELTTEREAIWQRGVGFLKLITGFAVAIVAVGIVIAVLQTTQVLERFVS